MSWWYEPERPIDPPEEIIRPEIDDFYEALRKEREQEEEDMYEAIRDQCRA